MDRSTERTSRVYLDPSVPRCEPSRHCAMRHHCAKYIASLPAVGASVTDHSIEPLFSAASCRHYVSAAACTSRAGYQGPERRKFKHWDGQDA